jgi:hypothetical protein
VQKLAGCIEALNKFIAKLAERSLPFFSVLQGSAKVEWGLEQQKAFDDLKQYLQHLPTLSSPKQGQPLILYISTTHSLVSGALVVEKEVAQSGATAKQQYLVYFVSEVLAGSKKYYSEVKKICYAIIMCSRKLRHYFKAHHIRVLTNQPLHDIFRNRDSSRRIGKRATELLEYVIDFERRNTIKSQILTDFMAEWMEPQYEVDIVQEFP